MKRFWQVQEAKSKFSALVTEAQERGPQSITRHGVPVAVLLSTREYERLGGSHRKKETLLEFFGGFPSVELEIGRDRADVVRDVDL